MNGNKNGFKEKTELLQSNNLNFRSDVDVFCIFSLGCKEVQFSQKLILLLNRNTKGLKVSKITLMKISYCFENVDIVEQIKDVV